MGTKHRYPQVKYRNRVPRNPIRFDIIGGWGSVGFTLMDDDSFIFAPCPSFPLKQTVADTAKPAGMMRNKELRISLSLSTSYLSATVGVLASLATLIIEEKGFDYRAAIRLATDASNYRQSGDCSQAWPCSPDLHLRLPIS
jgi:hypothetical protein